MQRRKKRIAGDRPDKNIKELRLENQGSRHQSDDARLPFYINIQDVYMKREIPLRAWDLVPLY